MQDCRNLTKISWGFFPLFKRSESRFEQEAAPVADLKLRELPRIPQGVPSWMLRGILAFNQHQGVAACVLRFAAASHWEALRLWLKGARLVPQPRAAFNTGLASGKSNAYTSPALSARGQD
jgi:hypothetical protein